MHFFINILSCNSECKEFINDQFLELKRANAFKTDTFNFQHTSVDKVEKLLSSIDSTSSAGLAGIPTKTLVSNAKFLAPMFTKFFNNCIDSSILPDDFKAACVTPLFKNKGKIDDVNNYRGISVLIPVAKVFEKILGEQIMSYFSRNLLFFDGQHGFRADHSCETALHEILSDMNEILHEKLIALFLFIDFRKAFDLVDSDLLLLKLFHYGFSNSALALVKDYFSGRKQVVKFGSSISSFKDLQLGVPQGSVLGPLFFLIFINDLALALKNIKCKLFADDTTLYLANDKLDTLITSFTNNLKYVLDWCNLTRLDINWKKTFIMFITNKHLVLPKSINIFGHDVNVVESFKLLGVTIDNKLNFCEHVALLRNTINRKLYSIKKLFYLSMNVKLQFFKSFVLPYFDYCLSLTIYFSKGAIQKLSNCFYLCLLRLFNFKALPSDITGLNNFLEKYGLFSLTHRIICKLFNFSYKIANSEVLIELKSKLTLKEKNSNKYDLRNKVTNVVPFAKNRFGEATFGYFFNKLLNNFPNFVDSSLKKSLFSIRVFNNVNIICLKFISIFTKFNLNIFNFNLYKRL